MLTSKEITNKTIFEFFTCLFPFIKSITEALFVSTLSLSSNLGTLGQIVCSSLDASSSLIISNPSMSSPFYLEYQHTCLRQTDMRQAFFFQVLRG